MRLPDKYESWTCSEVFAHALNNYLWDEIQAECHHQEKIKHVEQSAQHHLHNDVGVMLQQMFIFSASKRGKEFWHRVVALPACKRTVKEVIDKYT